MVFFYCNLVGSILFLLQLFDFPSYSERTGLIIIRKQAKSNKTKTFNLLASLITVFTSPHKVLISWFKSLPPSMFLWLIGLFFKVGCIGLHSMSV